MIAETCNYKIAITYSLKENYYLTFENVLRRIFVQSPPHLSYLHYPPHRLPPPIYLPTLHSKHTPTPPPRMIFSSKSKVNCNNYFLLILNVKLPNLYQNAPKICFKG